MSFINRQFKAMRKVNIAIIVFHVIALLISIFFILKFNQSLEQTHVNENLLQINSIYILFSIIYPFIIHFNLSGLRKGKRIYTLDQRSKFSDEEKELYRNNLSYILYYFLRGFIYVPTSILGLLIIGTTIIKNGNNEFIYFFIGFFVILINLFYTILNYPQKVKLFTYLENCKISESDIRKLKD